MKTVTTDKKNKLKARSYSLAKLWARKPLSAYVNILRVSWARFRRAPHLKGMPVALYCEPTTYCNLKCPACPTGLGIIERPAERLHVEHFKKIIDAIGNSVFRLFMYNWGEPLLHKDLPEMIAYAANRGIAVHISTNLSMPLRKEQCMALVQSGLYFLQVSIDGASPETHAKYRRGSDLNRVHHNLRTIIECRSELKSKLPKIKTAFLRFAHNENEVDEYQAQMSAIGVDKCAVTSAWIPASGDFSPSTDSRYNKGFSIKLAVDELHAKGAKLKPCTWLYYASVINPGGSISPCCSILRDSLDFGTIDLTTSSENIRSEFMSKWNGDKYSSARQLFSDEASLTRWRAGITVNDSPDGCVLSQLQIDTPLICSRCFVPHTVHKWTELSRQIMTQARRQLRRACRRWNFSKAAHWLPRYILLKIATILQ